MSNRKKTSGEHFEILQIVAFCISWAFFVNPFLSAVSPDGKSLVLSNVQMPPDGMALFVCFIAPVFVEAVNRQSRVEVYIGVLALMAELLFLVQSATAFTIAALVYAAVYFVVILYRLGSVFNLIKGA